MISRLFSPRVIALGLPHLHSHGSLFKHSQFTIKLPATRGSLIDSKFVVFRNMITICVWRAEVHSRTMREDFAFKFTVDIFRFSPLFSSNARAEIPFSISGGTIKTFSSPFISLAMSLKLLRPSPQSIHINSPSNSLSYRLLIRFEGPTSLSSYAHNFVPNNSGFEIHPEYFQRTRLLEKGDPLQRLI